jgi:hypothetical protein
MAVGPTVLWTPLPPQEAVITVTISETSTREHLDITCFPLPSTQVLEYTMESRRCCWRNITITLKTPVSKVNECNRLFIGIIDEGESSWTVREG